MGFYIDLKSFITRRDYIVASDIHNMNWKKTNL